MWYLIQRVFLASWQVKQVLEIVLHVGTNDLKDHSSRVVAEQIVDLGNQILSSSPDTKVTISALTQSYDEQCLGKKVTDYNKVIKSFCNQSGRGFIKHPNIVESCVNNQKLHLNKKGIIILASNLVNHISHWFNSHSLSVGATCDFILIPPSSRCNSDSIGRRFKMASLNVISLLKHLDELRILLNYNWIALLAINETRLHISY